jgi:flagellar hook-associated protein 3 FlgL
MIGRITNQMTAQMTLANIEQAMDRVDTSQQELSSGKRINQPSDDPYGTSLTLQLNGQLAQLTSYTNNVTDGTAWTQAATSALSGIDSTVQRVRELVVQASNGTNTAADDQAAAAEVNQLIQSIKQNANAQYNGQYIFSGTSTQTAPYQSGSDDAYHGGTGAINRQIGPGATVQVNSDISQLLGSGQSAGDGKLLDTLRTIASDMQSGNTSALGGADLTALDNNYSNLTSMETNVGAVTDQLQMASTRIQALQTGDTQVLSNTEDADMASTEIAYSTQQAAFQAALQAGAQIVQTSLMNFLSTSAG